MSFASGRLVSPVSKTVIPDRRRICYLVVSALSGRALCLFSRFPTQSELRSCGCSWWLRLLHRIPCLHRGFGCSPCGRQSDVTGTAYAPVTSPHSKSADVMTSPNRVCTGNWLANRILRQTRRLYHLRERAIDRGFCTFSSCAFTTIDFRGFDPPTLTDLFYTFSGCSHLTTIYADATWALPSSGITGSQCFYSCGSLVGGNGTAWASSKTAYTYFRIDTASTPG